MERMVDEGENSGLTSSYDEKPDSDIEVVPVIASLATEEEDPEKEEIVDDITNSILASLISEFKT